ncbi:MAG: SGNH/GDSL hydrolase family protein [Xanthomonadales bacterium]|nr:SGNH/GDSL hydrolase family protein [Xanthomonadales bacterium]
MKRVLFWLLFPFVLPQALYVRRTAPRSPGAGGPNEGRAGSGQSLSVLIVGDSLAAGVGAATLDQALAGHSGTALARRLGRHVRWKAVGRSGASSHDIAADLMASVRDEPFDIVVISAGVNDVTSLRSQRRWLEGLRSLHQNVSRNWPEARVALVGLPPMEIFPLLPQPLRALMGMRARSFDQAAKRFIDQRDHWVHVDIDFAPGPGLFSEDGFHPSEASYRDLGGAVASELCRITEQKCQEKEPPPQRMADPVQI